MLIFSINGIESEPSPPIRVKQLEPTFRDKVKKYNS